MSDNETILLVDDEPDILEVLSDYLSSRGYHVLLAQDGNSMRAILEEQVPQVVLLDINLPGEDGLSLARYLRTQQYPLAIIMLTGAGDVIDRVVGLEMGADDYIAKPFDLREVLARIKSVIRRYHIPAPTVQNEENETNEAKKIPIGTCSLDLERHQLIGADEQEIPLTSQEYELLSLFATHPNRVLSRDQILDLTQNREWDPYDRSIDIRITRLRRKIELEPGKPQIIKTVRGSGYIFIAKKDLE